MPQIQESHTKMRAWQVDRLGNLDQTLRLIPAMPIPSKSLRTGQVLLRVASVGLNPADFKMSEEGLINRMVLKFPRTPGMDLSGIALSVGSDVTDIKPGDRVLARIDPTTTVQGALSEYVTCTTDGCAALPPSLGANEAAAVPTAALTAYQSMAPYVKPGSRIFINGGSGGVGSFGIQCAKILGCHVTTSCSTDKASLCTELGADEIIDYKKMDVIARLKQRPAFDLIIDNVGDSISELFSACGNILAPEGRYLCVGTTPNITTLMTVAKAKLLPGLLGGTSRKFVLYFAQNDHESLVKIVQWMSEKRLRSIVDSTFSFDDVPEAYRHLKKGSSAGKVVVRVAELW